MAVVVIAALVVAVVVAGAEAAATTRPAVLVVSYYRGLYRKITTLVQNAPPQATGWPPQTSFLHNNLK